MNIIEITNFDDPALDVYARYNEAQLLHLYEPKEGVFIAESPKVVERAIAAGYEPISFLVEDKHIDTQAKDILARHEMVPVYTAPFAVLTKLTGFELTRGMLCAMRRRALPTVESLCEQTRRIVILENVVNPTNIGAIFRSAAALNMDAILLTRGCSNPLYRRAIRVSMGTVFQIPWTFIGQEATLTPKDSELLHGFGFKTVAMALKQDSVCIDHPTLLAEERLAIVLGTEGDGLASTTIADCDYTVMIPMSHEVDSLNVAAASAVAFWELGRK